MDFSSLGSETNFEFIDWCIVSVYLLLTVGVAVYVRRFVANVTDFILAGREVKSFLAISSMIGSEIGLVTVMYSAQKGFTSSFAAFHIPLAASIVALAVGLSGFIVVPLRRMRIMTIPEFYEKRFGRGVRILGGIIMAFSGILCMGMYLKAGSIFVMGVTGLNSAVHLKIIITVLLALVLVCIVLGGMVSVVVLNYIQFVVLSFSMLATVLFSIKYLKWHNIIDTVSTLRGQAAFDPLSEGGFGLHYILWMFFMGLVCCAVWQTSVMNACAAKDTKVVKRLYIWSSIGFLVRFLLPCFLGISAFVYISRDEALMSFFFPADRTVDAQLSLMAMPFYLSQLLPAGIIGFVTAGMLAALMSTHNTYLLCWGAILTQDVVAPWFKDGLSSKTRILLSRIFIVAIGIFILVWGLWYPLGQDLWDYMMIAGAIYGAGAAVLLIFGIYWKRSSKCGAYLALICGFCSIFGLKPVQAPLGIDIPSSIVGLVVVVSSAILMVVGSLLFPDTKMDFNNKEHYKD